MPRNNRQKTCLGRPVRPSIRRLLVRRLIFALAATWIVAFGLIIYGATEEFEESLRSRIANSAPIVLGLVAKQPDLKPLDFPIFDPAYEYYDDLDDFLVVITRNGALFYASTAADPADLVALPDSGHVALAGKKWTVFGVTDAASGTRVVIGFDETETWKSALQLSGTTAIHFMVATAMIVLAIFLSLRAGLRPLENFADDLSRREAADLSPLDDTDLPAELDSITRAMNGHLERLSAVIDQERDFVSNAAHELRTPLTAIQSQVEAFDPSAPPETLAARKATIVQASRRGARMISQLLDHSRSQSVQLAKEDLQPVDLAALLQQVTADLIHRADERQVDLTLDAPSHCTIRSEPDLLAIILRNVIDNAVKYAGHPGRVHISAREKDGLVRVVVEDDGPGMTVAEYDKAFGKFVRLGQTEEPGAGLGLTIISTLCDRLGIGLGRLPPGPLGGLRLELTI